MLDLASSGSAWSSPTCSASREQRAAHRAALDAMQQLLEALDARVAARRARRKRRELSARGPDMPRELPQECVRRRAARGRAACPPAPLSVRDRAPGARGLRRARRREVLVRGVGRERPVDRLRADLPDRAHAACCKATVPYLSQHFRVVDDGRPRQRPLRPAARPGGVQLRPLLRTTSSPCSTRLGVDRVAVVGISATAMTALRLAAEQPRARDARRSSPAASPSARIDDPQVAERVRAEMRPDARRLAGLPRLVLRASSSPSRIRPSRTRTACATAGPPSGDGGRWAATAGSSTDVRELARRVTLPDARDPRRRRPARALRERARRSTTLVPGARLLTIGGGGHLTAARDPVVFNRAVRDFVGRRAARARPGCAAMSRKRRALFISSPIGLGHVQRDLAIARELRKLQPDLEIDWFTVDPAARLPRARRRARCTRSRSAWPTRAATSSAWPASTTCRRSSRCARWTRSWSHNFMTFADLMEAEHYDIVIGDEAWDVDYYYHENPELQAPAVRVPHRLRRLPADGATDEREAHPVRRPQRRRHRARRALPVRARRGDLRRQPRGRDRAAVRPRPARHPRLDRPQLHLHAATPCRSIRRRSPTPTKLRARHGYRRDEKLVDRRGRRHRRRRAPARTRSREAFPRMKRQVPELRMILVAGPRLPREAFPPQRGPRGPALRAQPVRAPRLLRPRAGAGRPEHLHGTGRDAPAVPELSAAAPFRAVHPRAAAGCTTTAPTARCDYHASSRPRRSPSGRSRRCTRRCATSPVETDGAARAARRIAQVLDNRWWSSGEPARRLPWARSSRPLYGVARLRLLPRDLPLRDRLRRQRARAEVDRHRAPRRRSPRRCSSTCCCSACSPCSTA